MVNVREGRRRLMWNSMRSNWERWLLAAVLVVVAVGVVRWNWYVETWDWLGEANGEETNSSTVRNFALIFLSVVAIRLTWKRIEIAAGEAQTSRQNLLTARDALQHSEKTLSYTQHKDEVDRLHNRHADASRRLSSGSMSARLGAIYELQDLTARDLSQFHIRTMRMLCAFVKFPPLEAPDDNQASGDSCGRPLRPDVQAAMEVIGSRAKEHVEIESKARYRPDLRQAQLINLELRDFNLSGIDMSGGRFWGAYLVDTDLSACVLHNTDFSSPWFVKGLDPDDLPGSLERHGDRADAVLNSHTVLIGTDLSDTDIWQTDLSGADLQSANLSHTELPYINLTNAHLLDTDFTRSDLVGANLSHTNLREADLSGASLVRANLTDADLRQSAGNGLPIDGPPACLTQAQLDQACADPDNPPKLDEGSGLVWNGQPCST